MGAVFEECKNIFEPLKRRFEEMADIDLSDLELLTVGQYWMARVMAPQNPLVAIANMVALPLQVAQGGFDSPFRYSATEPHAIMVDELGFNASGYRDFPLEYILSHEFSHAVHARRVPNGYERTETMNSDAQVAIREGFAIFYSTDIIRYDAGLQEFADEMHDAIHSFLYEGQESVLLPEGWLTPEKARGYLFFTEVYREKGLDGVFEALENPPSMAEITSRS